MATAQNNPCGLSYNRTLQVIKDKVLTGNYNGRTEVLNGLLKDGFNYSEAKQVTDYYFKVYKSIADKMKNKKPALILSPEQTAEKRIRNLALEYLNGNTGGFPMSDADVKELERIYAKAASAETATLKEKFNEEAAVFVQKFLPGYSNELFKTSVYARPLLSAVFFIKSLTSNLHAQIERSITDSLWDGETMDFNKLKNVGDLANNSALNVLAGGVPATSLYQSESNTGTKKGRLEEFSIEGTEADGRFKAGYYKVMKLMSKWSNRLNSAPDTRCIFSNAERHFYQLLKEEYRNLGHSQDEAVQMALKDMELDDKDTATKMAEAKFNELGLPIKAANGKNTKEFNVAVSEYQRLKRDETLWGKALQLSKNDFWKRNMTVASELGFGDYGIFGLKAQALSGLRDKLEQHNKNRVTSAFNLYAFGFLNGAANFAEDAVERIPLYAAVKWGFLQSRKGKVTDDMLKNDIARRQRDIISKNLLTFSFFVAARMAEHLFCPSQENKVSTEDISSSRTQIGVCGIPVVIPPQLMVAYKFYKIIEQAARNDEEFFDTVMNVAPVLSQANQIGLGGAVDKVATGAADYATAKAQGNEVKAQEAFDKTSSAVVKAGTEFANNFLPIPSRLLNEAGTVAQKIEGKTQKQQELPFAIDEMGKPLGFVKTLGKVTVASLGNVTGISEVMIAAFGANKTYAVDWQGRKVVQLRGSDIVGNGIQYTAPDDIIATAGVKAPYINRLEKILVDSDKKDVQGFLATTNVKSNEIRYLTDEEYFNVSVSLGNFNKQYFTENYDAIVSSIKENKSVAAKQIKTVFAATKEKALEALEKGNKTQEEILNYINDHWKSSRKQQMTETTF